MLRKLLCIASALAVVGCATTDSPKTAENLPETAQKEIADAKFRGRWWSYYQRAMVLMRHELFDEAEGDLLAAMARRRDDTRWARTYGLHFLSEYFPNRELGIVYFEREAYDDAERYLEQSYGRQATARAGYYLDRVRERRVRERNEDTRDPSIEFGSTASERPIAELSFTLAATVSDDTYVRSIEVNGEPVPLDITQRSYSFEKAIEVNAGRNAISVTATDIVGRKTTKEFVVRTDHDGPALSEELITGSNRFRGHVVDETGVAELIVGGQPVALAQAGPGIFEFSVPAGGSTQTLEFACTDTLGNVTRGTLGTPRERTAQLVQTALHLGGEALRDWIASESPTRLAAVESPALAVRFTNLAEGQRYLNDNVIVGLAIDADAPIDRVEIDGEALPGIVLTAAAQQVTRRVALARVGPHEVVARVRTRDGREADARVSIERRLPQAMENAARLRLALLGNLWAGATEDGGDLAGFVAAELPASVRRTDRFAVVDRDALPEVLNEQELSQTLSQEGERIRVGRINQADYLLIGDVRRFGQNLEMVLHVLSAATGDEIIVDVYGLGTTANEIAALTDLLGDRLAQEFPMARGAVLSVGGAGRKLNTELSRQDRVWPNFPVVVYREVEVTDPATGQSLGTDFVPLAEGVFSNIGRENSVVSLIADPPVEAPTAGAKDFVVTK